VWLLTPFSRVVYAQCTLASCSTYNYNAESYGVQPGASAIIIATDPSDPNVIAFVATLNANSAANGTYATYTIATSEADFETTPSASTPVFTVNVDTTTDTTNLSCGDTVGFVGCTQPPETTTIDGVTFVISTSVTIYTSTAMQCPTSLATSVDCWDPDDPSYGAGVQSMLGHEFYSHVIGTGHIDYGTGAAAVYGAATDPSITNGIMGQNNTGTDGVGNDIYSQGYDMAPRATGPTCCDNAAAKRHSQCPSCKQVK
jgi:hypothetical protein